MRFTVCFQDSTSDIQHEPLFLLSVRNAMCSWIMNVSLTSQEQCQVYIWIIHTVDYTALLLLLLPRQHCRVSADEVVPRSPWNIQWFRTYKCWSTVLSCVHHHSLHLLIRKSCEKHVAWTWYDTHCKNCQCGNYKCERISGLEKQKSKQKLPTLYPGNSAVGSSILCYISRFSTVCGGRQLVSDCSQLPPLHLPLICIKKQPYWIWSKG